MKLPILIKKVILKIKTEIYYHFLYKKPPKTFSRNERGDKLFVIFYSEYLDPNFMGIRFRIKNLQERLDIAEIKSSHIDQITKESDWDEISNSSAIVVYRTFLTKAVKDLINFAKGNNIPIVYSSDDLNFHKNLFDRNLLAASGVEDRNGFLKAVSKYQEAYEKFDIFLGSTKELVNFASSDGKKTYLIANGLSTEQVNLAQKTSKLETSGEVTISYFSGTRTHQKDFEVVKEVLKNLLNKYPNVKLKIVGLFEPPEDLVEVSNRVVLRSFATHSEIIRELAGTDINIAPIQTNKFTNAKSELKYFEAGIMAVPTVASPTEPFLQAIESGKNGFIATTKEDWYKILSQLVESKHLRLETGEKAYQHVVSTFTPVAQSKLVAKVFAQIEKSSNV